MWIGVVADTRGTLHPRSLDIFEGMDFVLHCGGIGDPKVLLELSNVAPTSGVIGQADDDPAFQPLNRVLFRKFGDLPLLVMHDIGSPARPNAGLVHVLEDMEPKALLFGSTLEPFSGSVENRLWFNPGSASQEAAEPSVGILEIDGQAIRGEIVRL
jgi:uncharacterized protein